VREFALRQPVGGDSVMLAQLSHLALIKEPPAVTLRVLPAAMVSSEAMIGSFTTRRHCPS
jgi:hypothetical protein